MIGLRKDRVSFIEGNTRCLGRKLPQARRNYLGHPAGLSKLLPDNPSTGGKYPPAPNQRHNVVLQHCSSWTLPEYGK